MASTEDLTSIKLMKEIMELDQDVKLRQTWIQKRVELLNMIKSR